ncbi:MAG: thermonuclease family protein [Pseudomonadota bacterium]
MLAAAMICLVVGIADGDTLTARCGDPGTYQQVKVRLAAIDAPEKKQPYGQRSRATLARLCFQHQATIRPQGQDRYGRTVADVECQDMDAGKSQVRAGMAWVYRQYAKGRGYLQRAEDEARGERLGLWADAAPVPPWEFRHPSAQPDAAGCITGPRGGRYTLGTDGRKHYGC